MIIAQHYLKCIKQLVMEMEQENEKFNKRLSFYDKKISELYHNLEQQELESIDKIEFLTALQGFLRERRVVKLERECFKMLYDAIVVQRLNVYALDELAQKMNNQIKSYETYLKPTKKTAEEILSCESEGV